MNAANHAATIVAVVSSTEHWLVKWTLATLLVVIYTPHSCWLDFVILLLIVVMQFVELLKVV